MLEILEKFESLAREWRDLSHGHWGTSTFEYGDEFVSCYFANGFDYDSDFSSVTFGGHHCQIQVAFHSYGVRFGDITLNFARNWQSVYEQSVALLEKERENQGNRDLEQYREENIARIKLLRRQLAELEAVMASTEVAV